MSNNYLHPFVSGFLYVFGLSENPSAYISKKYNEQNDAERLSNDWYKIGNDIRKSYETYKATVN